MLVFREGLECILVLAAITASLVGASRFYRRLGVALAMRRSQAWAPSARRERRHELPCSLPDTGLLIALRVREIRPDILLDHGAVNRTVRIELPPG